jgi:hypothetical protein
MGSSEYKAVRCLAKLNHYYSEPGFCLYEHERLFLSFLTNILEEPCPTNVSHVLRHRHPNPLSSSVKKRPLPTYLTGESPIISPPQAQIAANSSELNAPAHVSPNVSSNHHLLQEARSPGSPFSVSVFLSI